MGPIYIDGWGDNTGKKTNLRPKWCCEEDPSLTKSLFVPKRSAFSLYLLQELPKASQVARGERSRVPVQETQEMLFQYLDQEDPLEEEIAPHSSILT